MFVFKRNLNFVIFYLDNKVNRAGIARRYEILWLWRAVPALHGCGKCGRV
jgi:hypothetical protein